MSDDSDSEPIGKPTKSNKKIYNVDVSPSSTSSSGSFVVTHKKKCIKYICDDSDSDSSLDVVPKKKRLKRFVDESDDASDSSGSSIVRMGKKPISAKFISESDQTDESDVGFEGSSEWENDEFLTGAQKSKSETKKDDAGTSTDSSNDDTEKCPICLMPFKQQEIGSPESCDHNFCVKCIQEWSKNNNTCPVDRRPFTLILVRKNLMSKIVRQIPVEMPARENDQNIVSFDDRSFCEICGSDDREDRMLLCDGCDLAFHLECLTPPLTDVPPDAWYCPDCDSVVNNYQPSAYIPLPFVSMPRHRNLNRLAPRTRQNERLRARIAERRNNENGENNDALLEENLDAEAIQEPSTSRNGSLNNGQTRNRNARQQRKRKKKRAKRVKITYEVDPATGETIAVKKTVRKRKSRRQRERVRAQTQKKSVKKRLAAQLGICRQRTENQHTPDVRAQIHIDSINQRRFQAGIPTLHLFGRREELDYFSESETEFDASNILVRRRRPNMSDLSVMRRSAQRKRALLPAPSSTTGSDLLGSILESQMKFHSKHSVFILNKDGSVQVELNRNIPDLTRNNNSNVNINNHHSYVRQVPMYPNSTASDSTTQNEISDHGYQTNSSNGQNSPDHNNFVPTSTISGRSSFGTASGSVADSAKSDDYSSDAVCSSLDSNKKDKNKKEEKAALSRENTPCSMVTHNSDSEFDIYSDIETVSTSKVDDIEMKQPSPAPIANLETDEEQHESDTDLVIDTEKFDPAPVSNENDENTKEEAVSSTVDSIAEVQPIKSVSAAAHSTTEIQSETVQSSSQNNQKDDSDKNSDDDSEDGCPNFSIYSSESINLAKTTELSLQSKQNEQINSSEISSTPPERDTTTPPPPPPPPLVLTTDNKKQDSNEIAPAVSEKQPKSTTKTGLYSDSEDESIIKIDTKKPFGIGDLRNMTEDISEEERSYTPCLDEKDVTATTTNDTCKQGIEGLDTEMISDEDRNDFDESHELKTASDGDALEINAKESELDFTRPEDYEEGEIVDKVKANKKIDETNKENETKKAEEENKKEKKSKKSKEAENDKTSNKENESQNKENKESTFKKLSKSNKERNYRDKDRSRSKERKDKSDKNNAKEKKERRREIERYDVRSLIAEKPRRVKDQFGRDEVRKRSLTPSSRSASPYRSVSRGRRSYSRENIRKRRGRSRDRRSVSRSRSRSHERKRSLSKSKKRRRSLSKERPKRKKSRDRSKNKTKKTRSISRHRSRSVSPKRRRNWERRRSRDWTPSLSRSKSPVPLRHNISPSWTPPRLLENQPVKPHNLTVILTNDSTKKRKDKKKKSDKKQKDAAVERQKKRRRDRTPLPSKEVFASGDNILVSVSFNKDTEERDVTTTKRKRDSIDQPNKKSRKEKRASKNKKKSKDVSSLKPVAIIDLERSPFRVIIPSPKDVIVLSDSENGDSNTNLQKSICDSSAQAASPEQSVNNAYSMGPKTPPEPQVKFSLNAKPPQLRPISNPLHEPDDVEPDIDPQEELEQRLNEVLHKGPNTPPEPPNSPPSSPDAYDPFDPTKSRSPTPEPIQNQNQSNSASMDDNREDSLIESRPGMGDAMEKTTTPHNQQTPDATKSHTPPIADVQPADSQSSSHPLSPDAGKSPERINVVINQVVQSQASTFPAVASKPVAQTTPYSSVAPTLITSTPISSSLPAPRINILSSTILTSSPHVASSVPQRIVLPNTSKSSPVKISPTKPPIKSTPIKPMPTKNVMNKPKRKSNTRNQIANEISDVTLDFESPYSPRSSDYEDLFDPPTESYSNKPPANTSKTSTQQNKNTKSPAKIQNAFDALFGSSPVYNKQKNNKDNKKFKKVNTTPVKGTKQVGVKLDEDSLKILDELPNSAVEMQVKDKFLKKLNRQERVVEEVKLVLKPHYNKKRINKEEYKDILRRAVPKICHNKSGEINPKKIQNLIEAYVKKVRHSKKVTSSSSVNPQKVEGKHGRSNKTLVDQTVENWLDTINRNTAVGHT